MGGADREQPSAGEREGRSPWEEEPSAGEREGRSPSKKELFQERAVKVEPTGRHYALLTDGNGDFLGIDRDGAQVLSEHADDQAMWTPLGGGRFRHAATGTELAPGDELTATHGPEKLPSEYLAFFRDNGWVCLTCIIAPELVDALQRVACTDGYAERTRDSATPQLCQDAAVAKTAAEPVSLWLIRQYMRTDDICLGHAPALIVLGKDDGKRNVQGWHSDYPYHWGIRAPGAVPTPSGATVLGVQRNVCVSAFTKERGATAFKLGSHALDRAPPEEWGTASAHAKPGYRAEHGLPYNGPDADVVEAPAGSIILYDARTWHRAGVNRTDQRRAAMLQAMVPLYVVPKNDTGAPYKRFVSSPVYADLNRRERREMRNLMVHRFPGAFRREAMATDPELRPLIDV